MGVWTRAMEKVDKVAERVLTCGTCGCVGNRDWCGNCTDRGCECSDGDR